MAHPVGRRRPAAGTRAVPRVTPSSTASSTPSSLVQGAPVPASAVRRTTTATLPSHRRAERLGHRISPANLRAIAGPSQVLAPGQGRVQRMELEEAQEILGKRFKKGNQDRWGEFAKALEAMNLAKDVPDELVGLLAKTNIPWFYLPTTSEIWQTFIDKIRLYHAKPLELPGKIDLRELKEDGNVESFREELLSQASEAMAGKLKGFNAQNVYFKQLKPLEHKILGGELTSNFRLDTLFKMTSPRLLNAFEVASLTKETTQNVKGDLAKQRVEAEDDLFPLIQKVREKGQGDIDPVLRPRYAALNFKGYDHGAAPRNDYGLSYMVLKDRVKRNTTITAGDTFDAKDLGAFPLTKEGVTAMLWTLAKAEYNFGGRLMADYQSLLDEGEYDPGETYLDAQIHQDLDIRRDVEAIYISTAEMKLFNVDLKTVDRLIQNLTGGVFVREV